MEIKFRGLRKDNNEWVFGYYFIDLENKLPYIMLSERKQTKEDWMVKSLEVIPESVGQFVGLHDKNGKEIYCGDIVQHHAWDYPFEVIYHQEKARFVCKMKSSLTQYIDNKGVEIIGNLYENKDLINQ